MRAAGSTGGRRYIRATVVTLAALPVVVLPAAPAMASECTVGKTQFVADASPNLVTLGIPQAWRLATGKGVTVAVVDSGVDVRNQHLGSAVLPGTSFVGGDPKGWADDLGHGTAVAGIVAARYIGRKSSLIGAAPDARILPVRVFQYEPSPDQPDVPHPPDVGLIAKGVRWAVDHGADVINVSMSTDRKNPQLPALTAALRHAHDKDVVVVASAGNNDSAEQARTELRFPAAGENVIGVAANNASGVVDSWTVHGPHNDVAAPGQDVLISYFANGDCVTGERPFSSWAAGFVSGLAAQLRERFPQASADEIAYRIMASADRPRQGSRDDLQGWGTIQPYEALTMTLDPTRPGPALPGAAKRRTPDSEPAAVRAVADRVDPLAGPRRASLWWGLAAIGTAAIATMLRPLVAGRRGPGERRGRRRLRGRRVSGV